MGPELFVYNVHGYVWRVYACMCACVHKWVHVCMCGKGICICECVWMWTHMCEWVLSRKFGLAKKLVRETKIPGIMVCPDHFPLKNLVRTWNNGPSTIMMFDHDYCLWKGYGSALEVVSSIREPRYVTRKEKQSPEVAGFPWNKLVVCFNWSTHASA